MKSFDTIYRRDTKSPSERPIESPKYWSYFYKSLQIVLSVWIVTILAIITQPWLDLWAKSAIKGRQEVSSRGVAGDDVIASGAKQSDGSPRPDGLAMTFQLKNAKVNINAPIVEGIDKEALRKGIGHHSDSVWPNQQGNIVLAGHNYDLDADNPYREIFISLRLVDVGDEVTIAYQGKTYYYQVFKKETVKADDNSLFGKSDEWLLTFYTCDPPYTDWKRLVLQAKLTKIE